MVIYDKMLLSKLGYYDLATLVLFRSDEMRYIIFSKMQPTPPHRLHFQKKEEITVGLTVRQCGDLS